MEKVCKFCKKEIEIEKNIVKSKKGENLFSINNWFFAYCKCDCGKFIVEREDLEEGWIPIEEKIYRKHETNIN